MTDWSKDVLNIETFNADAVEKQFKAFLAERELGVGAVLPLFRLLVTGKGMGPSMFDISEFLGKEECAERLTIGLEKMAKLKPEI